MLDDLIKYFRETRNHSLLARIYGVFTIKTDFYASVDVILMQNVLQMSDTNPTMIFDLKGSTKNRLTQVHSRFWRKSKDGRGQVLKDMNYVEINNDLGGRLMQLGKE